MKKFEVGAMYWDTSAVDHNDVMVIKITRRTEKSVWFVHMRGDEPEGEPARTKIFTNANYEYIMPYRYSMAPVWDADRKVEPEAAANDEPQEAASDAPETADDNKAAAMTAQEETARKMIAEQTTEYLLKTFEGTTTNNDPFIPTVRGWLMDELQSRYPEAFDKWLDSEVCEDAALREYINAAIQAEQGETVDAGEPDALEVVRVLGGTLNLIEDNGDEVEAMKARVALWEQVDEFKRRGVALNVEYDADGRFAGVTEPKAGMKFDELPESVQGKVKEYLRAYDDCSVTYERGAYRVSVGVGITARYAPDFKVCGRYAADDIFTPEERVLNYANSFYSYPLEYCGERDYRMMRAAQERGATLEYDSAGNIVAAA